MANKKVDIILEGSDLRFLGIYEKKMFKSTFFLAKPSHGFACMCLDNVKMYEYAKYDNKIPWVQEL